jgi:LysM repeat protein
MTFRTPIFLATLLLFQFSAFSQKSDHKSIFDDSTTTAIVGPMADSTLFTIDSTLIEEKIQTLTITTDEIPQYGLYCAWNNDHVRIKKKDIRPEVSPSVKLSLLNHGKFVFPYKGKLISPYGYRGKSVHTGTDIKLNKGDSVLAAFDGVVRLSKRYSAYGKTVVIRHYNGLETVYSHLSKLCVNVNQKVSAGDLVGLGGRTGRASTEHLHFETRYLEEPFNPQHIIDYQNFTLYDTTFILTAKTFKMRSKPIHKKGMAAEYYEDDTPASDSLDTLYAHNWMLPKNDSLRVDSIKKDSVIAEKPIIHKPVALKEHKVKHRPFVGPQEDTIVAKKQALAYKPKVNESKEQWKPKKDVIKGSKTHTVAAKDTLYSISKKYKTTVDRLCEANHLTKNSILSIGQKLIIPSI